MTSRHLGIFFGVFALPALFSALAGAETVTKRELAQRHFTLAKDQSLVAGGMAEKYLFADNKGDQWLFKPQPKSWAYADEMVFRLGSLLYLRIPECYVVTLLDNIPGSVCKIVAVKGPFRKLAPLPEQLNAAQRSEVVALHAFHWFTGNHDTHDGNFLVTTDNHVISVDHTTAFSGDDLLKYDLQDPLVVSRDQSYYNLLFRDYIAGKYELFFDYALNMAALVEKIPDDVIASIVRPLAELNVEERGVAITNEHGQVLFRGADEFERFVLLRKHTLRSRLDAFYRDMAARAGIAAFEDEAEYGSRIADAPPEDVLADLDNAFFVPIDYQGDKAMFSHERRIMHQISMILQAIVKSSNSVKAGFVSWLVKSRLGAISSFFNRIFSRGYSKEDLKRLPLEQMLLKDDFFEHLNKTGVKELRYFHSKIVRFLKTHRTTEEQDLGTLLLSVVDVRLAALAKK